MDKYGLIGYPLEHSFSKGYFNEKFQNEGIDAEYNNYEISSIESLLEIIDTNPELKGLNVTIPYKKQVIKYLDALSPEAKAIGAVNVIRIEHIGNKTYLKGYNSDVIGFTKSIVKNAIKSVVTRKIQTRDYIKNYYLSQVGHYLVTLPILECNKEISFY